MIFKHYYCDLYKANVVLYAYCTTQEANDHYQQSFEKTDVSLFDLDQEHGGYVTPVYSSKGERFFVVWLQDDYLETLVHESFHVVARIFEEVGIGLTEDNHEPWAYYLEYWVAKFRETLKEFVKDEAKKKHRQKKRKEKKVQDQP